MKNDDNEKSELKSPYLTGPSFAKALGGLPDTKTAEEIMKMNDPGDREAAPGSFRPEARKGGNNEKE